MSSATLAQHHHGRTVGDAPSIVLVHGWPDSAAVWDLVVPHLTDRFHVVAVDLPGVGDAPPAIGRSPYRLDALAPALDDMVHSLDTDRGVHLVGHDWGGVLGWELVMTPAYAARLSSFTVLSGPSLDHLGLLARKAPGDAATARVVADQLARSWYTTALSLPVLRTIIWRAGADRAFRRWLHRSEGVEGYPGEHLARDAAGAVPLYRTNIVPRLLAPRARPVTLPVHVIVAEQDRYVAPGTMRALEEWIPQLHTSSLDAGHWSPRTQPEQVATLVTEWVQQLS